LASESALESDEPKEEPELEVSSVSSVVFLDVFLGSTCSTCSSESLPESDESEEEPELEVSPESDMGFTGSPSSSVGSRGVGAEEGSTIRWLTHPPGISRGSSTSSFPAKDGGSEFRKLAQTSLRRSRDLLEPYLGDGRGRRWGRGIISSQFTGCFAVSFIAAVNSCLTVKSLL
jgi:hypothetical protein